MKSTIISVYTPCFNEEDNVEALYTAVKSVFDELRQYDYEHIFIDNASTDATPSILRRLAKDDPRVKVILNARNYGVIKSPLHALLQTKGAAAIGMCADFQDPPELIPVFIRKWEEGYRIVAAVKKDSEESRTMFAIRKAFYRLLCCISETELIKDFSGYGLYDRCVIDLIRSTGDHYPYFRGLISEMGFPIARVEYVRPTRKRGCSKNRFYDLYAQAMNGIVNHSKLPLRLATFVGFFVALVSLAIAFGYTLYKLLFWQNFSLGLAPLVIGLFFLGAVQLIFLGILGEYIGAIHARLFQKWLVIEKERINFDRDETGARG
jgi:glycosyltransferase involved in cell wall biosynthesis